MCDNRANVGQVCGDSIDLPSALREIERLRADNTKLHAANNMLHGQNNWLIQSTEQQAARIKELEGWLKEEKPKIC